MESGETITLPLRKHNDVYIKLQDPSETMYTDQTGAFPVRSRKGNRYVMVACEIDDNIILSEPVRSKTAGDLVQAYQNIMKRLKKAGIHPKKHVLDNEAPQVLKDAICEQEVDYELVPKGQHRRNIAERAIQTFKSHFIGVLCGVPETFPMWLWDELLPQVDMQINLLRFSNVAPNVCAWTKLKRTTGPMKTLYVV